MASKGRERSGGSGPSRTQKLLTITVNGNDLSIDPAAMSLRERQQMRAQLAKLEVDADWMDQIAGQVWIAMRRDDPAVTFDEVLDALDVGDVSNGVWVDPEDDSPEA
jgi:hypothetical protein